MYAVSGVSGKTGAVVAERLLAGGHAVRVLVRDAAKGEAWRARGAEVAVADLDDEAATEAALRGVDGLYTLIPPVWGAADPVAAGAAIGAKLARAAARAKVGHVVLLSSVGAHRAAGTGPIRILHATERALAAAGVPTTAIRAAYFVENWGSVLPVAQKDGVLPSFVAADAPLPQVSTPDIGRLGAELLVEGPRGQRFVELAGPADLTPAQVAGQVSELLGRPVQLVTPPLAGAAAALTAAGLPPAWAELYAEMYRGLADG